MSIIVQPMIWARELSIDEVQPISDEDIPVLNALRDVLMQHNALGRFGIQLLHRHFDIGENESMVEYIDEDRRVLTLRAEPSRNGSDAIITAWRFTEKDEGPAPLLACRYECPFGPGSQHQGTRHSGQQWPATEASRASLPR